MIRRIITAILSLFGIAAPASAAEQVVSAPPTQEQLSNLKDKLSDLAIQIGKDNFFIKLDYSEDSIKQVEYILGEIHKEYIKTKNEEGLRGVAAEFGAYIIKVIEKHYEPGVWSRDHPSLGEGSFPYDWKGATIFPVGWCFKRIFDGEGDDIVMKYKIFVIDHAKKTN